ncbi:MAG TPA: sodium:solute symporter family protein [Phycisphaerae bacterium]|nr:sodium:solute symporter family protein [Phycisphaerae bacterium]
MNPGQTAVVIIAGYLGLLLVLGLLSNRFFRGTATDYFLASRGIGSFLLLMSLFGTTMTAFALVGSTGESFKRGIGVYGQMASWSGIIHSACFFLVGIKLWSLGKRHGYVTQIQFFRDRFESDKLGLLLFPVLVGLVVPYLLIGVIGAGTVVSGITRGAFPALFPATGGAVPYALGSGVICLVVLLYVFFGGVRGTAWANAFQTIVFIVLGLVTFLLIAENLGGVRAATQAVIEQNPSRLKRQVAPADEAVYAERLAAAAAEGDVAAVKPAKPVGISQLEFFTYLFIPLSVGMFPHIFQHWLTAKTARSFRLAVVAHPLLIMLVWVPCVLVGVWATQVLGPDTPANQVLPRMVARMTSPVLGGLLTAGILAAIMSSLDSQFLCVGSIFTNDIVGHYLGHDRLSDRSRLYTGRIFVVVIVLVTYLISLNNKLPVFPLGVWTFTGFASLFPLVFAALYWKRATKAGAYAAVLTTAVTWFWLFRDAEWGRNREYHFHGVMPVVVTVLATSVALIIVSLATRPPKAETLSRFFAR